MVFASQIGVAEGKSDESGTAIVGFAVSTAVSSIPPNPFVFA